MPSQVVSARDEWRKGKMVSAREMVSARVTYSFPVRSATMANDAINDHSYACQLYASWFDGKLPSRLRLLVLIGAFNSSFPEEQTSVPGSGAVQRPGYDGTDMRYRG